MRCQHCNGTLLQNFEDVTCLQCGRTPASQRPLEPPQRTLPSAKAKALAAMLHQEVHEHQLTLDEAVKRVARHTGRNQGTVREVIKLMEVQA